MNDYFRKEIVDAIEKAVNATREVWETEMTLDKTMSFKQWLKKSENINLNAVRELFPNIVTLIENHHYEITLNVHFHRAWLQWLLHNAHGLDERGRKQQ